MPKNTKRPARGTQPDYYRILGVDGNASPEEIAEAYRALVLQCHPDLNPGDPQAEARFLAVQAAFEALGNRVKRREYDRTRGPYRTYVPSKIDPLAWQVQLYPLKAKQPQWFQPNLRNLRMLVLVTLCAIVSYICGILLYSWLDVGWKRHQAKRQPEAELAVETHQAKRQPEAELAVETHQAKRQAEAVEAIKKLGGRMHGVMLDLTGTGVTDAGLETLTGLNQLQYLNLGNTQITDAGLEHLKGLTQLKWLDLEQTNVTDAGLENLKGLEQLQWLGLEGTKVTDAGVKKLQQALPKCQIFH